MSILARLSLSLIVVLASQYSGTAQTAGNGTISGRVTDHDRPLAGIQISLVSAQPNSAFGQQALARAETDHEGRFQLTGIPAGSFRVVPLAPIYVLSSNGVGDLEFGFNSPGKQVTLNDGETLTGIDLALVRGGVITGRVTDSDDRPVVEQFVQLDLLDRNNNPNPQRQLFNGLDSTTDDRGIYRIYGLPPGRYRVSCGEGEGSIFRTSGRKSYPRTFHPDVTSAAQAKIIEIAEGSEASGIDIRLSRPARTYAVTGRAVDADSGEGVSGVMINYTLQRSDGRPGAMGRSLTTGPNGEFRIDSISSGRYAIFAGGNRMIVTPAGSAGAGPGATGYSEPVPVEVIEGDVTGVELKIRRGATVSGTAVVEGSSDPAVLTRLSRIMLFGYIRPTNGAPPMASMSQGQIGPDRSFRFEGVRPGKFQISPSNNRSSEGNLTLLRIERDGVPQPDGIDVGAAELIGGVRLVFVFGNSVVRGQVNVVNGALPAGGVLFISARRTEGGGSPLGGASARADGRGLFVLEGLAPGQYELEARIIFQAPSPPTVGRLPSVKLPIVVAAGQVQQVTLTLDLSQQESRQ